MAKEIIIIILLMIFTHSSPVYSSSVINTTDGNHTSWIVNVQESFALGSGDEGQLLLEENVTNVDNSTSYFLSLFDNIQIDQDYKRLDEPIDTTPDANETPTLVSTEDDNSPPPSSSQGPEVVFWIVISLFIGSIGGFFVYKYIKDDKDVSFKKGNTLEKA